MEDVCLPQSWVEFGSIINEIWFCSLSEKNNDLPQVEIVVQITQEHPDPPLYYLRIYPEASINTAEVADVNCSLEDHFALLPKLR